jgi:hypothetical protein
MMKRALFSLVIVSLSLLFATSCASSAGASSEKSEAAKEFKKVPGKGVVYLYRPGRFVAAAVSTAIKVNGQNAGGTGPGTFFRWELKPGTYVFSAQTSESSAAVEIDVKPGEHYFVMQNEHIGLNSTRVSMKQVDEKTGMKEVSKKKLLVSSYVPEQ